MIFISNSTTRAPSNTIKAASSTIKTPGSTTSPLSCTIKAPGSTTKAPSSTIRKFCDVEFLLKQLIAIFLIQQLQLYIPLWRCKYANPFFTMYK